jgi:flavin-binding protein dodecin
MFDRCESRHDTSSGEKSKGAHASAKKALQRAAQTLRRVR